MGSVWIVYGALIERSLCTEEFRRWMAHFQVARLESNYEGFMIPVATTSKVGSAKLGVVWISPDTVFAFDDVVVFLSQERIDRAKFLYERYQTFAFQAGFNLPVGRLLFVYASEDEREV